MRRMIVTAFISPFEHFATSTGMECEQFDGKGSDTLYGFAHGVGDVVQLEVEKDLISVVSNLADEVGPVCGE